MLKFVEHCSLQKETSGTVARRENQMYSFEYSIRILHVAFLFTDCIYLSSNNCFDTSNADEYHIIYLFEHNCIFEYLCQCNRIID